MDIDKLNEEGYSYCDTVIDEKIIDKIAEIISYREESGEGQKKKNENMMMIALPAPSFVLSFFATSCPLGRCIAPRLDAETSSYDQIFNTLCTPVVSGKIIPQ